MSLYSPKLVLIGASTGGPGIIEYIISNIQDNYPHPICIVQHFPSELMHSFVVRLQTCTKNKVVVSSDKLILDRGMIVVAKGGEHLTLTKHAGHYQISQVEANSGFRSDFVPSVDEMFLSASRLGYGDKVLAILLSGIGDDGAEGMVHLMHVGALTVCQDEKSSPVFGMPRQAIERGAANEILSPEQIVQKITHFGDL